MMTQTTIIIPVEDRQLLQLLSNANGLSMNEMIRQSIRYWFQNARPEIMASIKWDEVTSDLKEALIDRWCKGLPLDSLSDDMREELRESWKGGP